MAIAYTYRYDKPRITWIAYLSMWRCSTGIAIGLGHTPMHAYYQWQDAARKFGFC